MEKLERLNFSGEGEISLSLEEFPNLKELKIEGDIIIKLDLPTLEVLECPYIERISDFGKMPNLKKLHITNTEKLSDILNNTPNLTHLQIENLNQTSFKILKSLKKLEFLNFSNEYLELGYIISDITDIKVLNCLPYLKEVNLFGFEKLEEQLNNPEVAVYYGMTQIHFHIYDEDDLWI